MTKSKGKNMDCCQASVVEMDEEKAKCLRLVNIFLPGFGTMISACHPEEFNGLAFTMGFL
jgi:hypothetical protein